MALSQPRGTLLIHHGIKEKTRRRELAGLVELGLKAKGK
jgi:hypothetical protein